jgi:hypothetical protein
MTEPWFDSVIQDDPQQDATAPRLLRQADRRLDAAGRRQPGAGGRRDGDDMRRPWPDILLYAALLAGEALALSALIIYSLA